jgi:DNA-binding PadR family transcriptional regulator
MSIWDPDLSRGRGPRRVGRGFRRLLQPILLLKLHQGSAHGYSLLSGLDEYDLGELDPSMVYRVLRSMEELKWVTSAWEGEQTQGPPRRIYRLSSLGLEVLIQRIKDLERSRSWIDRFLRAYHKHIREGEGAHH